MLPWWRWWWWWSELPNVAGEGEAVWRHGSAHLFIPSRYPIIRRRLTSSFLDELYDRVLQSTSFSLGRHSTPECIASHAIADEISNVVLVHSNTNFRTPSKSWDDSSLKLQFFRFQSLSTWTILRQFRFTVSWRACQRHSVTIRRMKSELENTRGVQTEKDDVIR